MAGLVVLDLGGGDAAITVVDSVLWEQIKSIPEENTGRYQEIIIWLTCTDPDVDRPEGAPDRQGQVLREYYTQTFAVEEVDITDVTGILTLPGG